MKKIIPNFKFLYAFTYKSIYIGIPLRVEFCVFQESGSRQPADYSSRTTRCTSSSSDPAERDLHDPHFIYNGIIKMHFNK